MGEGDFSFSAGLADLMEKESDVVERALCVGESLEISGIASSFDSRADLVSKYPGVLKKIQRAEKKWKVMHRVDALNLENIDWPADRGEDARLKSNESPEAKHFDLILWNHPHLGVEDSKSHSRLIAHFIASALKILRGQLVIRLLTGQAERWELERVVNRFEGLTLTCLGAWDYSEISGYLPKKNEQDGSFTSERTRKNWVPWKKEPGNSKLESITWIIHKSACVGSVSDSSKLVVVSAVSNSCSLCFKAFLSLQGLKTHKRQVHELSKYEIVEIFCEKCDRVFKKVEDLRQHQLVCGIKRKRADSEIVQQTNIEQCNICGEDLPIGGMAEHMEFLLPKKPSAIKCGICSKLFKDARALEQHKLTKCIEGLLTDS